MRLGGPQQLRVRRDAVPYILARQYPVHGLDVLDRNADLVSALGVPQKRDERVFLEGALVHDHRSVPGGSGFPEELADADGLVLGVLRVLPVGFLRGRFGRRGFRGLPLAVGGHGLVDPVDRLSEDGLVLQHGEFEERGLADKILGLFGVGDAWKLYEYAGGSHVLNGGLGNAELIHPVPENFE